MFTSCRVQIEKLVRDLKTGLTDPGTVEALDETEAVGMKGFRVVSSGVIDGTTVVYAFIFLLDEDQKFPSVRRERTGVLGLEESGVVTKHTPGGHTPHLPENERGHHARQEGRTLRKAPHYSHTEDGGRAF